MRPMTPARLRKERWRDLVHDLRPSREEFKFLLAVTPWIPFIVLFALVVVLPYPRFRN